MPYLAVSDVLMLAVFAGPLRGSNIGSLTSSKQHKQAKRHGVIYRHCISDIGPNIEQMFVSLPNLVLS